MSALATQREIATETRLKLAPAPCGPVALEPVRRRDTKALVIPIGWIAIDERQVRQVDRDPGSPRIQELAESLRTVGLLQPLGVQQTGERAYRLVYGEGRLVAARDVLGWTEIECRLVTLSDEDAKWAQALENLTRTDLNPVEIAAFLVEQRAKYSVEEIAAKLGKSGPWVSKGLTVGEQLGAAARAHLAKASTPPAIDTVYAIAGLPEPDQGDVARQVVEANLPRVEALKLVEQVKKAARKGKGKGKGKPYERTLTALGFRVTISCRKSAPDPEAVAAAVRAVLGQLAPGRD
jgi:ParB family chromosome partitioning protein